MGFVWRRPSLTLLELAWRWAAAVPLLYLAWHSLAPTLLAIPLNTTALESMTFLEPVRSASVLARQLRPFRSPLQATARWWVPLAVLVWSVVATFGRTFVLRRVDSSVRPIPLRYGLANLLRALLYLALLAGWSAAMLASLRTTVIHPLYFGQEPNLVLMTAAAVVITMVAFLLWTLTVWALDLQPLRAMTAARLAPAQFRALRSKLIETNLVMGIVRVILLVLALTFSASPLPFQTRETQAFINVWWCGVAILYILGSDFFHVVRRITYLRLLQSLATAPDPSATPRR